MLYNILAQQLIYMRKIKNITIKINKMNLLKLKSFFVLTLIFSLTSCLQNQIDDIKETNNSKGFDYKTIKEYNVTISTLNYSNQAIPGVIVELYSKNPLNQDGSLIADSKNFLIFKGITNTQGVCTTKISPAATLDSLSVFVKHIGLPDYQVVKLNNVDINVVIGGNSVEKSRANAAPQKANQDAIWWVTNFWKVNDFYAFATWNSSGVPNNLMATNDLIDNDFLADVDASLPERIKLGVSHPEFLSSEDDGSIVLVEDAEVWVTFVHEGAGNVNTLAYYTYPTNNPPANKTDISRSTLIFPNTSYIGSGGGLRSGNKVQLLYYNAQQAKYTNVFPAGTSVAWHFRSNGWSSSSATIGNGNYNFFSDKRFNPETSIDLRKHNVVLKDNQRKLLLIGFEDLKRDNGSDDDFNDAVFYASVTPFTAVKDGFYQSIDSPKDADNDGVPDGSDDYPNDPAKAFDNFYPGVEKYATLAFEDLWPSKGDYDFNDLIVDYNYYMATNSQNLVKSIDVKLRVRAIGASKVNGFGIELNTLPSNILSVTGQKLTQNLINVASNGTENNQEKAVIIAFDNAFKVTPHPGSGRSINVVKGEPYVTPGIVTLKIEFVNPISFSQLGTAPFNPFIFVDGQRGKEVHLPGSAPTSLADRSLFGKGDDDSNLATGKYYMSNTYLPWAINIPTEFDYPTEKVDIRNGYTNFNGWRNSLGFNYMDWYSDFNGYRDTNKIFTK
jgi:LruC domain-containing protein